MISELLKQKFHVILLFLGFIFIISSIFEIEDITKLQIKPISSPIYWLAILGICLILISILIYYRNAEFLFVFKPTNVKKANGGYTINVNNVDINVKFGKIEEIYQSSASSVVVLPANEYFDDACINDKKSALGSFMQTKYNNRIHEIQEIIKNELVSYIPKQVEKEKGVLAQSYGVGTCLFLDKPLASDNKIILASVTTKRTGTGLCSEISHIFAAVNEIQGIMLDKRLHEVFCPLMCAGHGGLKKEVALLSLILAFSEIVRRPTGHNLHSINIVVFKAKDNSKSQISKRTVKSLLKLAHGMVN